MSAGNIISNWPWERPNLIVIPCVPSENSVSVQDGTLSGGEERVKVKKRLIKSKFQMGGSVGWNKVVNGKVRTCQCWSTGLLKYKKQNFKMSRILHQGDKL